MNAHPDRVRCLLFFLDLTGRCPIVNGYEEDHHVADCTDEYWAEDESSSGCGSNGVTLCR